MFNCNRNYYDCNYVNRPFCSLRPISNRGNCPNFSCRNPGNNNCSCNDNWNNFDCWNNRNNWNWDNNCNNNCGGNNWNNCGNNSWNNNCNNNCGCNKNWNNNCGNSNSSWFWGGFGCCRTRNSNRFLGNGEF